MAKFKGLIKNCEVCGTEFKVPQSQSHVRTCSTECGYKIRKVANKKDKVELKCMHCSKPFFEFPSHVDRRKFCSKGCMFDSPATKAAKSLNMSAERNPGWNGGISVRSISTTGKSYRRAQAHVEAEKIVRRKRAIDKATPNWASLDKIREIYRQAQSMSKSTTEKYHVDHIVPLKSKLVSGLHTEHNLRILPALDNLRKHNRTWPDMW
jgi:DNA-directed RNA polymerase subunit RPC12/RpoP